MTKQQFIWGGATIIGIIGGLGSAAGMPPAPDVPYFLGAILGHFLVWLFVSAGVLYAIASVFRRIRGESDYNAPRSQGKRFDR